MASYIRFALLRDVRHDAAFLSGLTPAQVALLLYLKLRMLDGQDPPTIEDILLETMLNLRTVSPALKRLKELGYLLAYKPVASVNDKAPRRSRAQVRKQVRAVNGDTPPGYAGSSEGTC